MAGLPRGWHMGTQAAGAGTCALHGPASGELREMGPHISEEIPKVGWGLCWALAPSHEVPAGTAGLGLPRGRDPGHRGHTTEQASLVSPGETRGLLVSSLVTARNQKQGECPSRGGCGKCLPPRQPHGRAGRTRVGACRPQKRAGDGEGQGLVWRDPLPVTTQRAQLKGVCADVCTCVRMNRVHTCVCTRVQRGSEGQAAKPRCGCQGGSRLGASEAPPPAPAGARSRCWSLRQVCTRWHS